MRLTMITLSNLRSWAEYRQHPEIADRLQPDVHGISYEEWRELDELAARIRLDQAGLTSTEFRERTEELLRSSCADPQVIEELRVIARPETLETKAEPR